MYTCSAYMQYTWKISRMNSEHVILPQVAVSLKSSSSSCWDCLSWSASMAWRVHVPWLEPPEKHGPSRMDHVLGMHLLPFSICSYYIILYRLLKQDILLSVFQGSFIYFSIVPYCSLINHRSPQNGSPQKRPVILSGPCDAGAAWPWRHWVLCVDPGPTQGTRGSSREHFGRWCDSFGCSSTSHGEHI